MHTALGTIISKQHRSHIARKGLWKFSKKIRGNSRRFSFTVAVYGEFRSMLTFQYFSATEGLRYAEKSAGLTYWSLFFLKKKLLTHVKETHESFLIDIYVVPKVKHDNFFD